MMDWPNLPPRDAGDADPLWQPCVICALPTRYETCPDHDWLTVLRDVVRAGLVSDWLFEALPSHDMLMCVAPKGRRSNWHAQLAVLLATRDVQFED